MAIKRTRATARNQGAKQRASKGATSAKRNAPVAAKKPPAAAPLALLLTEIEFGQGARTTLRVPDAVADAARTLAEEIGTSKNDAIIRLAAAGARVVERAREVAEKREARWSALVDATPERGDFPDAEEMRAASFALRDSGE